MTPTKLRRLFETPDETDTETDTEDPLRAVLSTNRAHYYDTDTGETICQYELPRPVDEYPTLSIEALDPHRQVCEKCDELYRGVPSRADAVRTIADLMGFEGERRHFDRDDMVAIRDELLRLRAIEEDDIT